MRKGGGGRRLSGNTRVAFLGKRYAVMGEQPQGGENGSRAIPEILRIRERAAEAALSRFLASNRGLGRWIEP